MRRIAELFQSELHKDRTSFTIHLLALCAFAIAQPLFDLVSKNADFLTAHHAGPIDIAVLALALCIGPPLVLVLAETVAAVLLGNRVRTALHWCFVTSLVTLIAAPALKHLVEQPGPAVALLALLVGLLFTACYGRFSAVRTFVTLLSVSLVVFPAKFIFFSPVSQIVFVSHEESTTQKDLSNRDIPIVFIVFDEFPVTSIMDPEGNLDKSAVPNLAKLAENSTWYRNASTVSDYTTAAVPAMLTGRYPREYRLPHVSNYPGNLFTLVADSYRMNVVEPFTGLCPQRLLGQDRARDPFFKRLGSVGSDLLLVYLHYVLPKDWAEGLPDVTKTLKNFADRSPGKKGKESRVRYFDKFIQGIEPSPPPSLNFLHIMFPHVPWVYYPSGKRYNDYIKGFAGIFGLKEGEQWQDFQWAVDQAYQRHLLQVGYVDKLIGRLVSRLRSQGLYERSLIIITADHGVSFIPGDNRRRLNRRNFQDIAGIPLFIKRPFQDKGMVDDRVVESIDIVPTVASILGIAVPWKVDGISLVGTRSLRTRRTVYHYGERVNDSKKFEQKPVKENWKSTTLRRKWDLFGTSSQMKERYFAFGPYRDLIGQPVAKMHIGDPRQDSELVLDNEAFFKEIDQGANFLFGNISGQLTMSNSAGKQHELAIAVNGIIQAVTRTAPSGKGSEVFSALVPQSSFQEGGNQIRVFEIRSSATGKATLYPLVRTGPEEFTIDSPPGQYTEFLVSSRGERIPVIHGALLGRLAQVVRGDAGDIEFIGWAADKVQSKLVDEVLVFADGRLIRSAATNWHMPAVARFLGGTQFVNSGFWFTLPAKSLENVRELRLFAVSRTKPGIASELNYVRGYRWAPRYGRFRLSSAPNSDKEVIVSPGGSSIVVKQGALHGSLESVTDQKDMKVFSGWAAEAGNRRVPHMILIFADSEFVYAGKPNVIRRDIAGRFSAPHMFQSGFKFTVPERTLKGKKRIRVFAVSQHGTASEIRKERHGPSLQN
jgi:hypothetical protein